MDLKEVLEAVWALSPEEREQVRGLPRHAVGRSHSSRRGGADEVACGRAAG